MLVFEEAQITLLPVNNIISSNITKEFQTRCPYGRKTKLYKKAKLEKFAEYLLKDGLVSCLSSYNDYGCEYVLIYIICFRDVHCRKVHFCKNRKTDFLIRPKTGISLFYRNLKTLCI